MKAVILCGGVGERMKPLTLDTPKPLLKIGGQAILEYVFENLKKNNIFEVILTVGYLKEKIIQYFGDGKKAGIKIEYLKEDEKKNTAGSILPLKGKLGENFIVMMGDQLTNINIEKMKKHHEKSGAIATIALKKKGYRLEYGVVEIEKDLVKSFREKPVLEKYVNTGIYIFRKEIFSYIKEKEDFAKNVFPRLLEKGEKISAYLMEEDWVDIGRLEDYQKLIEDKNECEKIKKMF
ncbi:MAG: nucleotidyltransferase family protein [Candidatus Micrarchaeia archaeon]